MSPQDKIFVVGYCPKKVGIEASIHYVDHSGTRRAIWQKTYKRLSPWCIDITPVILRARDEGRNIAILDLRGAPAINSDIFSQWQSLFWWMTMRGVDVVFARPAPDVVDFLKFLKWEKDIPAFPTVEEAIGYLCNIE